MPQATEMMRGALSAIGGAKGLDAPAKKVSGWVTAATRATPVKNLLSGSWLGHQLHPMLTDVPIGAFTSATLLDLFGGDDTAAASRRLVGVGILASAPTAMSGASDWSDTTGEDRRVGLVHGAMNGVATVIQTASWFARRRGHRGVGAALSLLAMGLTLGSAYLGGHLSYARGVGVNNTAFQDETTKWTDVAADADLVDGALTRVDVDDVPVLLVRQRGELRAISAVCSHAGGPLEDGTLDENGCVTCPWHGSRFDTADGAVKRGPASVPQPRWEVRVEEGRVLVRSAG